MSGMLYSTVLQWKLDMRNLNMLVACYAVPLAFFAFMGGVFTSVIPGSEKTLIPSMTVFAVSMGALIGLPPSLAEIYGGDIRKSYQANGVPLVVGLAASNSAAAVHLLIMSIILCIAAPAAFDAAVPADLGAYFGGVIVFIAVSLGIASIIGLSVRNIAAVPMVSILVFLPSVMLSGIMFPAELLPEAMQDAGSLFPATWGYRLMSSGGFTWDNIWPMLVMLCAAAVICAAVLRRIRNR